MLILIYMEEQGSPISEFAKRLSISTGKDVSSLAVKSRLVRRGIKPFKYIGPTGLYREADFDAIKDAYLGKHPVKKDGSKTTEKPKAKTAAKPKKPAKKN